MINKWIRTALIPILSLFLITSSFMLVKAPSPILLILTGFLFSSAIVGFIRYVYTSELEKKRLQKRYLFLKTYDPVTKLLNYEAYIRTLTELTNLKKSDITLVLLDFQDFKSINHESISSGNEILLKFSIVLRTLFPDAIAISRYAGDRFALVLPESGKSVSEIGGLLRGDKLGYEVTYSTALYPKEAGSAQEIIALAEDRLFQNKRLLWLKRQEDLFQAEKMKIVGELAAGMAHEIRNPLTAIKGFMQLSKNQSYNVQPWFEIIMQEIARMSELTSEFLQFSKPHISNMKPESIAECIERVRFLTESQALSRGHQIHVQHVHESVLVHMERDKFVQVLLNLIRNALEAMEEPGHIVIRAKPLPNEVIIEIEDTGIGIPETELQTIFNPFYTTKEDGTGLGLSVCYKIVQDHGGSLSVESEPGRGSVFAIKLPTVQ